MDLFTIADAFLQTNFTCLPVLDNEKLVGCVCRRRMLAAITTLQQQTDAHRATALELNKLVTRLEGAPLARILVLRNKPHSPLYRV
ncbi:MAG: hypothetical protein HYV26_03935, partial [Candidatus Hydrogenedentes bacterium]|nr:hypothetical protein [Candidatus Hydrogenedentota bacterium]